MTMTDPLANTQLELACRVGSLDDIRDALEEGADINCNGCEPLFIGIMAGDRNVVLTLVEAGADYSMFEIDSLDHEEVVEALMKLAPVTGEEPDDDTVDGKRVRAFDKMIRSKGLAEPLRKGKGEEYPAFRDSLKWIAAEECHAVVSEFLEMLELVRSEAGADAIPGFLEDNPARVTELSERYACADEAPGDLLKDYLKERKKVA